MAATRNEVREGSAGTPVSEWRRVAWIVVLLVGWYAVYHGGRNPVLRFAHPTANYVAYAAAMLLPGAALLLAERLRFPVLRVLLYIISGLACMPAALFLLLASLRAARTIADGGVDGSFEPIRTVLLDQSALRVYRTNGGATASFGIVVRHEMAPFTGVRVVRDVYHGYPAYDVEVGPVTTRSAVIGSDTVELRPLVWF